MSGETPACPACASEALDQQISLIAQPSRGGDAIDLKKGGIFPIVHGVRAWALDKGLEETNTAARIRELAELGVLDKGFARELTQSLFCLMTLKLDAGLGLTHGGARVDPGRLTAMDRDLLRDALRIVKQFKDLVHRRFNLAMF